MCIRDSFDTVQTFDEALPVLLDQTLMALGTNVGTILIYSQATNDLRDTLPRGWFKDIATIPVSLGEGVAAVSYTHLDVYKRQRRRSA